MDTVKRANFEKRLVLILVILFSFTLLGALKNAGILKIPGFVKAATAASPKQTTAPLAAADSSPSAQAEPVAPLEVQTSVTEPKRSSASQAVAGYTAQDLRDPLKDLLPQPSRGPTQTVSTSSYGGSNASSTLNPSVSSTRPLAISELSLQGLIWGGPQPQAIINHQTYKVGDRLQSGRIVSITRQGVVIEQAGDNTLLSPSSSDQSFSSMSVTNSLQIPTHQQGVRQ